MKKLLTLPALLASLTSFGQAPKFVLDASPVPATVCYSRPENMHTQLPLPAAYLEQQRTGRRAGGAKIEVTYKDFSPEAQKAFQHAVDIWQSLLVSPVTIRVQATWTPLAAGVLGSAGATEYYSDLSGATRNDVVYPVALAEKISGRDLNATDAPDINARFSSTFNWYYGLDGKVPAGKYDLVTVVLHELGHGLGFIAGTSYANSNGSYGNPPSIFSTYIENMAGEPITNNPAFPNVSAALGKQFTSNQLYFNSPLALAVNDNKLPKLYAPATYSSGSSISHLDESTYKAGDINSLMSPQVGAAEAMHNPGPITLKMFDEMGWFNTAIRTTPLKDSEVAKDFPVKATIVSDGTVTPGSVKLNYAIDNAAPLVVTMTTTDGTEYQGVIPNPGLNHKISYFITASDNETKRTYTAPANYQPNVTTVARYSFMTGADVIAPIVRFRAANYVFADKLPLQLTAQATDNVGVASVTAEYAVNGTAKTPVALTRQGTSDTYTATIGAGLVAGDVLTYRLVVRDLAANANQAVSPATGQYTVNVVSFKPAQPVYTNNFNATTSIDFVGEGFQISKPTGFADAAIHSNHPYDNDSTVVYQMLVPIKVTKNTTLAFDEVVLAEPGDAGVPYGGANFYDYMVVEGSTDQGATWKPLADGYDSNLQADWLAAWNLGLDANTGDSKTVGTPALLKPHTFALGEKFSAGSEVRLRFRLSADQLAHGWGWLIDNMVVSDKVVSSVASELKANGGLSLYPNPNTGQFRVKANFSRPTSGLEMVVRNMLGQVVYRQAVPATATLDVPVDLGQLANGLYQLSLGNGADAVSRKIQIQR